MKKIHLTVIGLTLLALTLHTSPTIAAEEEVDVKQVATLMTQWIKDRDLGEARLITGHLAEDFVGVGPFGQAEDRKAFVDRLANPKLKVANLESTEQSIRLHGTVVVVTGLYTVQGALDGRDLTGTYRYLDVARKKGDRWFIISSSLTKVQPVPAAAPSTAPASVPERK